jgi:hypothetical protein
MDANLINCSNCGHSISSAAKICAYCGASISEGEPVRQTDERIPGEPALSTDAESFLQQEEHPPVIETPEPSEDIPKSDAWRPGADIPDQPPAKHTVVEPPEPALNAAAEKIEDESVIELAEHGQLLEPELEVSPVTSEIPADEQTLSAEAFKPRHLPPSDPMPDSELMRKLTGQAVMTVTHTGAALQEKDNQIKTETAAKEPRVSSEPDILELTVNEPAEPEASEAEIMEMIEGGTPPAANASMASDKSDAEAQTVIAQDVSPVDDDDKAVGTGVEVRPEASEDDILLTLTAEVQPALDDSGGTAQMETAGDIDYEAAESSEKNAKSDISSTADKARADAEAIQKQTEAQASADILKIEKAAQDMEEALKKQKVAMAEAQLLKKEKLNLAKAEAVKQKKVALARAQALKKQRKAQANIHALKKEEAVAYIADKKDSKRIIAHSPEAKTKMTDLLKKYQGQAIGINYDNSADIKKAELVAANDEFFSVFVEDKELQYSYPLKSILTVIESKDGVGDVAHGQEGKFSAVIKVYPLASF